MTTLNLLGASQGFSSGDLKTDGYLAVTPAWQKIWFSDGRTFDKKGYHKLDFINTKITGDVTVAAFTKGETVTQAGGSNAVGIYDECIDIKITGTVSAAFTIGELVTQATTGAKGYVAFSGAGFINVYPIDTPSKFNATSGNTITGATSSSTLTTLTAITARGYGRYHFIYRTSTEEFHIDHAITGATSGAVLTPIAAVQEVQTCTPNITATSGTFTMTYNGQTTAAIAYNATTAAITTALELLSTVEVGDITVGGTIFSAGTGGLTLTFLAALGDVPMVSITETMGGTTAITVTETTKGVGIVLAPPHWLPWIPYSTNSTAYGGDFPDGGSNIGCLCFGRIFLNSMLNPNQWWCSRVFDPLDFDTSQDDVAAATYSQNAKAGEVGDVIVAMIPYKDFYLIWGCANEMWILQSDPLMGGVNRCLSKTTGIFSPTSYCWDDKNNLYFLGTDGIYSLPSEAIINAQPPQNITKQRIPKLITSLGLNRRTDRVAMAYDKQRYGIEVSVTQQDAAWSVCFWIDLRTGGLFPDKFPSLQSPASMFYYDSYKSSERGLLLGGYDGYIRKFDETTKNDEGTNAIDSWLTVGPFAADGEPRKTVNLDETSLILGEESDGVVVDIFKAKSADEVINNIIDDVDPLVTKTLTGDGLKNSIREKVGGRAIAIKIGNETAAQSFSMEEVNISLKQDGREK